MVAILFLFIAYLVGSIPNALIIGKLTKGIDIRQYGSHNLGSTNAIRVLGKKIGLCVFALDVLKGAFCVGMARILFDGCGFVFKGDFLTFTVFEPIYYGIAAAVGHLFPIFAGFKGGKAVATGLGITFVIAPIPAVLCLIVFYITLKISGYVSLSSTFAILTVLISAFIQHFCFGEVLGYLNVPDLVFLSLLSLVMIIKHRKNYIRIIKGTENSFKKKKPEPVKENQEENNK